MPLNVLEEFIRQYIGTQDAPEVLFAWQGGEPTLMGVNFFRTVLSLQQKHANGKNISNTIQTNGTLLNDEWCSFFKEHEFLVGLSIDGPQESHDQYRVGLDGQPTFGSVMAGVDLLKKHRVQFNTLTVLNDFNTLNPLDVYRFLKEIGDGHMQFIPAVERAPGTTAKELKLTLAAPPSSCHPKEDLTQTSWSVSPKKLASFYISVFDEWVRNDVGTVFVQFFDIALGNWLGAGSGLCHFSPQCGMAGALEHNGDLYSCDHYVYPDHKLGNILKTPLSDLMQSEKQLRFGTEKQTTLTEYCTNCDVRFACHGDCPKHRFAKAPNGEPGQSYLCHAYKEIFTHMAPYMETMLQLIRAGKTAPEIMNTLPR